MPMEWVIQIECRLAGKVLHRKHVATTKREATPQLDDRLDGSFESGIRVWALRR